MGSNVDQETVDGFGEEWVTYDQNVRSAADLQQTFDRYFSVFPWEQLPAEAVGFDAGCGSGRWARLAAPRVGRLIGVDPAAGAAGVAARNLAGEPNAHVVIGTAGSLPFADGTMDFGYSLGVLHHTPEPAVGLADCVRCLKPGAPFLVYLYYALDNRPAWFRALWKVSDTIRRRISKLPAGARHAVCTFIAAFVYFPLARTAKLLGKAGDRIPLSAYKDKPFSVMRTDAFDRFATQLEWRFTRDEVVALMEGAGLTDVQVRDGIPYWCAAGTKA